jgi:S1-C subfamily serine protease/pSer/pThr/pTyr-binding forkhead associated (FHA) protein
MPYLRLVDLRTGAAHDFEAAEVRIGRDPQLEFSLSGSGADVVSGQHARFVYKLRRWWIEDTGSRNGTFIGDRRLNPGESEPLVAGTTVRLGKTGPQVKIEAAASRAMEATQIERGTAPPPTGPPATPPVRPGTPGAVARIVLQDAALGERHEAEAALIRIGRGGDCQIRPLGADDELVSRVHAEIALEHDGTVVIRDAGSVNGTYLNGQLLEAARELKADDQIALGDEGPVLIVQKLSVGLPGKGITTLLVRRVTEEVSQRSAAKLRRVVWLFVALLIVVTSGVFMLSERRDRATVEALEAQRRELEEQRRVLEDYRGALAAQQATTDSVLWAATSENERLRQELMAALEGSAPAGVIDSLREAVLAADQRTAALEASLARSQAALTRQLAAGDSLRREATAEVTRLRGELERARATQVSAGLVDSLRQAIRTAEQQASNVGAQLRAVSGVNLASLAQANQGAVGLVTVFQGINLFDGSGFAITESGYFVTNRHVVQPNQKDADSVFVTMADERFMVPADVIAVAPPGQPDLALLKIREFGGPYIERVDWGASRATQGEPAALIGFPAGLGAALDQTRTVRTSMSAGIFSKVTGELIQFDGFTVEGSSGSPVFNASGEVVGVHRGSLRGSSGLGFAVPVAKLISLMPPEAKLELGIE